MAIAFALATVVFVAQPARADFTPPNTPKLTKSVEVTAETGATKAFYDSANGVIHVVGTDTLTTYDATTLEVTASSVLSPGDTYSSDGMAFDPEHSTLFVTQHSGANTTLEALQYLPADHQYSIADVNIPPYRTVVYSSELDRVYSIATAAAGFVTPSVAVATFNPDTGAWVPGPSYPNIDIGANNMAVQDVVATSGGSLAGTYVTTADGIGQDIQLTRKPIYSFTDTDTELDPVEIPGTQQDPATFPFPTTLPIGYADFTPAPSGSFTATEANYYAATRQMITLDPTGANPSGFAVNATALTLPFQPAFTDFDAGGDLYLATGDTVSLYEDGALLASSDAGPAVHGITGGDGHVYAFTGASSPYKLAAMSIGGYSPTITTDPAAQGLTVASASESKSVTFHSGATGTPDPTVRWQRQLSGQSTWDDVSGATSPDLTFGATAANNGDSYRAVYTNIAGEIATASAPLTVNVVGGSAPVIPPVIPIVTPAPAAPLVKNGKSVKLKFKKGKSAKVTVGTVTCVSASTCVYTLPTIIKFKIGTKSFKATVTGPSNLEPGKSEAIYATVPAKAVKALKGKKTKLIVSVQVANSAGVKNATIANATASIRG
jgi:hypothetical protein